MGLKGKEWEELVNKFNDNTSHADKRDYKCHIIRKLLRYLIKWHFKAIYMNNKHGIVLRKMCVNSFSINMIKYFRLVSKPGFSVFI